jgi:NAD(P)-dependent dehydrogenase (short-subunit alcohol dehydrogenase family)
MSSSGRFVPSWSLSAVPLHTLAGKTAIVTGANSGIGYFTALEMGRLGARVILAVRDLKRGQAALDEMLKVCPRGNFVLMQLDVSSLQSVHHFTQQFLSKPSSSATIVSHHKSNPIVAPITVVDILVNNAGIMMTPTKTLSKDGFELQMATNHLGHFALTMWLMPCLLRSASPRVIAVGSVVAWFAQLPSDKSKHDLKYERTAYHPRRAYAQSKLANLLFAQELGRRFPHITSVAAHPGGSATNLHQHAFGNLLWLMQTPASGALPTLRAVLDPAATSGSYFGPCALMVGCPTKATLPLGARSESVARALWDASVAALASVATLASVGATASTKAVADTTTSASISTKSKL